MFITYFTEQPYTALDADAVKAGHPFDHPARLPGDNILLHSNRFFDPVEGARLYRERILEYELAEQVGFDGIMLNEHHNVAFCMQPRITVMSSVLAARTNRIKIMQLGSPLPVLDNPVQLAEDTAMIDMISGGRLITGIVRGGGSEQISNNVNPAFNRERFQEAHELLLKTWTQPGPFRWEGEHYQFRVVNPWARPLQTPHPRIFVPGIASKDTIEFAARHGYPFFCLNTSLEDTKRIWAFYDEIAQDVGYKANSGHRGYLMRCHVAATEEKALENARQFLWMTGEWGGAAGTGRRHWVAPTGYSSWEARKVALKRADTFEEQMASGMMIAGTPKQAIEKIRFWLEETGPGCLILWGNDGRITHQDSLDCIRLLGEEVLPAVREIGASLGLEGPFEGNQPVSFAAAQSAAA